MLNIDSVSFFYGSTIAIDAINLQFERGKVVAVIGESGCGKSTLLKLIYGLIDVHQGQILWNNSVIEGPKQRLVPGMAMMKYLAQDFDLMPYITVAENVGAFLSNSYPEQKRQRITELLEVVEMAAFANHKTKHLSGGQMQRVALAKALALQPEVLLLDEPFSHIDCSRKNRLRRNLFEFVKNNAITVMIATHDSTDVLSFADEIVVLQNGKLVQHASTQHVYNCPNNSYVAGLFGDINEISSVYFEVDLESKNVLLFPHQLFCVAHSRLKATVKKVLFRGSHYLIEAVYNDGVLFFEHDTLLQVGVPIYLSKKL